MFQVVVFLEGDEAAEALDAYWHGGAREVLDVLTDYDEGVALEVSEVSIAGADDESMRIGDYNVIVNPDSGTAALEVVA
jgi:hypothetical protein